MKVKLTLTPEAAEIVRRMYEHGELADVGVVGLMQLEGDTSESHKQTAGHEVAQAVETWVIGRAADCDIVISSLMVSKRHAMITKEGDKFYIEDLQTLNGTFVNGKRLDGRSLLKEGDSVQVGDHEIRFRSS